MSSEDEAGARHRAGVAPRCLHGAMRYIASVGVWVNPECGCRGEASFDFRDGDPVHARRLLVEDKAQAVIKAVRSLAEEAGVDAEPMVDAVWVALRFNDINDLGKEGP